MFTEKALERFWRNVDKNGANGCWVWTAGKKTFGYGQTFMNGKNKRSHRVSWQLFSGQEPPAGLSVCHRCDNPSCVNPDHLFLGTQKENIRDAENKGRLFNPQRIKTHCRRGHQYSVENTRVVTTKKGYRGRYCRKCEAINAETSKKKMRIELV